jgi:hypothetical protein
MKVIDLLVKISKGEEMPKKIRIDHWHYKFEWAEDLDNYYDNSADIDLMSALSMSKEELNYGVEIIEESKEELEEIELIDIHYVNDKCIFKVYGQSIEETIAIKVNELIDEVNKLKKERRMNNE